MPNSYEEEEEYETDKDSSMMEEVYPPDLRAIMVRIQALVSTVALLQLASGRRQPGQQSRKGKPSQIHYPVVGQAQGTTPHTWPPLDEVGTQNQHAARPDTLADLGYLGYKDSCLRAFPEIFYLL